MSDGHVSAAGFRSHRNSHIRGMRAKTPYGNAVGTSIRFLCANTEKTPINTIIDDFSADSIPVSRTKKSTKKPNKNGGFRVWGCGNGVGNEAKMEVKDGYLLARRRVVDGIQDAVCEEESVERVR